MCNFIGVMFACVHQLFFLFENAECECDIYNLFVVM